VHYTLSDDDYLRILQPGRRKDDEKKLEMETRPAKARLGSSQPRILIGVLIPFLATARRYLVANGIQKSSTRLDSLPRRAYCLWLPELAGIPGSLPLEL
jgi:hypothetical protein